MCVSSLVYFLVKKQRTAGGCTIAAATFFGMPPALHLRGSSLLASPSICVLWCYF